MTKLPFMDGFEQFVDSNTARFKQKLAMAEWLAEGDTIAPGAGRYGDTAIVCRRSTLSRELPFFGSLYFGFAVNKTDRGQLLSISAGDDTMVLYTSRLDGLAYMDDTSLDAIPLNSLWYFYEVGMSGDSLTVRINDRELATVPLKPGIAASNAVRITFGATVKVPAAVPPETGADDTTNTYDDFYANSSGFMGTIRVITRFPTGTWLNEWQMNGAESAHAAVGEMPFNEMNRHLAEEVAGNTAEFVSNKIIPEDYPILATGLVMVARKPQNLNRAVEVSISENNGHVEPRSEVVEVTNSWDMHYVTFSKNSSDTPELLRASPFALKLVNS